MARIVKIIKGKNKLAKIRNKRGFVQFVATLLSNPHVNNFKKGSIYTGKGKITCVPGLNCYSCPGAAGSCPIGSLQAVIGSSKFSFTYYITGLIMLIGVLVGRFVCGFLCPFGWFQDLLHKIPSKKFSTKKFKLLRYLKYLILFFVVYIMGSFLVDKTGIAAPYFCKYICPQGVLEAGIPLSIANPSVRAILGNLFTLKFSILVAITVLSVFVYRPFCKWLCPLGAFYALLNKVSFYQYKVDKDACVSCGKCAKICKMDVDITKSQNALECIRCGECIKVCPTSAISTSLSTKLEVNKIKKNLKVQNVQDER